MANAQLSSKAVGSIVKLKVGGTAKEFIVVHQGKPSSIYDESCNGTWLLMKDIYENRVWQSGDINKYESSDIHAYLNSTFLNLFDSNIKDAIKQVKIPYRKNGGSDGTDQSGANGLPCKVFLLSGPEAGLAGASYIPNDGTKLDYFNANTGVDSKRIAYLSGTATAWWLRSPSTYSANYVLVVNSDGGYNDDYNDDYASNSSGIRPALMLPQDMEVDSSGNVTPPPPPATHKTLVNGTAYEVKGGKCMVNGTVYNILKGRTLIDGTGYDVALPTPMPKKGDLIQMNLDGTSRQYRVLRMDGSIAEVLTMWNLSTSIKFNSTNTYSGSILDKYLNTTWYNTLSSDAKAAIVPKNITQDSWHRGTTGSPQYSGTYGNTAPGSTSYTISKGSDNYRAIGSRYVYAISIQEILDYLSDNSVLVDTSGMLRNQNIWKMFWNQTTDISEFLWLRSASADDYILAWYVNGYFGYPGDDRAFNENAVRGALQIDLSKIDFTIT
jgi:hypothetical protein